VDAIFARKTASFWLANRSRRRALAREALAELARKTFRWNAPVIRLSIAEQQVWNRAGAVRSPKVLIMTSRQQPDASGHGKLFAPSIVCAGAV